MPSAAERLAATKPRPRVKAADKKAKRIWSCRVRELREKLGLSVQDVADACGMSSSTLWQIECGANLLLTSAKSLADFFGRPIPDLWPELNASPKRKA